LFSTKSAYGHKFSVRNAREPSGMEDAMRARAVTKVAVSVVALAACGAPSPARAEPATIDPALFVDAPPVAAREIFVFTLGGSDAAVFARGRRGLDTGPSRAALENARDMRGFLPGYPQPAVVTFELRVSY
jgi:hypothetical protein